MTDTGDLKFVNIHGDGKSRRRYAYFRSRETGRIALPDPDGDRARFLRAYADALDLHDRLRAGKAPTDQARFDWLVDSFLASAEYKALADSTQVDYLATCDLLKAELGDQPFRYITRAMVKAVRDDLAATSRKANKVQQMTSRIYSWGQEADLVPVAVNPAAGLKKLKRKGGVREYVPWSDAEIGWFCTVAPAHALTPAMLALYTGQRRKDVRLMTWQQFQGDVIRVRTSKTHQLIDIPCHPALAAYLEQLKRTAKVVSLNGPICLSDKGVPWATENAMSGTLRRVVQADPRIPNNRGLHGLRYAAAARMDEGGASPATIAEVLGQRTFRMALKYASGRLRAAQGVAAMKGEA